MKTDRRRDRAEQGGAMKRKNETWTENRQTKRGILKDRMEEEWERETEARQQESDRDQ